MAKDKTIHEILANNLVYYRKSAGYTQLQIATRFNYSDKAVSKWERGECAPDIFVIKALADFYGISVNDFLKEKPKVYEPVSTKKHLIIVLLSCMLALLVGASIYTLVRILAPSFTYSWLIWLYSVFAITVVTTVFAPIWGTREMITISVSLLSWVFILDLYLSLLCFIGFDIPNLWLLFIVGAVFQIMIVLWHFLKLPFLKGKDKKLNEK